MKLSLIIPAYNEEKRISQTLIDYLFWLRQKLAGQFELIVVVNGSIDQTAKIISNFQAENPEVVLIEEVTKIGKGGAVRLGFAQATGEWLSFVDADNAIPPIEWWKLWQMVESGWDGAIASRFLPGATTANRSWLRNMAGHFFSILVKALFQLPFKDTQCGAKIFKGELIRKIRPQLFIADMAFDVELLWRLQQANAKIKEVGINWQGGPEGAVSRPASFISQTFKMVKSLLKLRLINNS